MVKWLQNFLDARREKRRHKRNDYSLRLPNERGARYVLAKFGTYYLGALYNDLRFGKLKRVHTGRLALGERAAIYLIFPNNGVLASHLDALDYMQRSGYAPIVVSNVALSEADRARLLDHSHLVIERHNFGYDFGGYRDGVLAIKDRLAGLRALAIFNDSCWFPIQTGTNWLDVAEAKGLDFVGAASHFGIPIQKPAQFRALDWRYETTHHFFHYTSYALLIGAAILSDPNFLKFWQRFPTTDIKRLVVRRGEAGLTQWVIRQGYTHGDTLDLASLGAEIRALPRAELQAMVDTLIVYHGQIDLSATLDEVRALADPTTQELANIILSSVLLQGASYAIGEYLIRRRGFDFLKKSPLWLSQDSSRQMLALVQSLEGELGAHVRAEALVAAKRVQNPTKVES